MAAVTNVFSRRWLDTLLGRSWLVRIPTLAALAWFAGALGLEFWRGTGSPFLLALGVALLLAAFAQLTALAFDEPFPLAIGGARARVITNRGWKLGVCITQAAVGSICLLWVLIEITVTR